MAHSHEDKSKKIKHITIEPLEEGFLYTLHTEGEKEEMGFHSCEDYKYSYQDVEEVVAAIKDDLGSPHVGREKFGSKKFAELAMKGRKKE